MSASRIMIIAGEASGDLFGSYVMRTLKRRIRTGLEIGGVGGERMATEGLRQPLFGIDELSVMGFKEVFLRLRRLMELKSRVVKAVKETRPDCVLFIDSKGFSGRVAAELRRDEQTRNTALFQYASPSIWAWRSSQRRSKHFASLFDALFLLFPFEKQHWEALGITNTYYVGSPVLDNGLILAARSAGKDGRLQAREELARQVDATSSQRIACILPGSRAQEIRRHAGMFYNAARTAGAKHIVLPCTSSTMFGVKQWMANTNAKVHIVSSNTTENITALQGCDAAITKPGTVVLEAALLRTPMTVAYSTDWLTSLIARQIAKVQYAAIPNLLANRMILPEFLLDQCNESNIADSYRTLLTDGSARSAQIEGLEPVIERLLESKGPAEKVVELMLSRTTPGGVKKTEVEVQN